MSTTVSQATAAPIEFIANGKTYRISPLRDRDFGEFERWCQDRYIEIATRNLSNLTDEDRKEVLKNAFDKAVEITFTSKRCTEIMNSIEGALEMAFLALRHEHPDIARGEIAEFCRDPKVFEQLVSKMAFLNKRRKELKPELKKNHKVRKQVLRKKWGKK